MGNYILKDKVPVMEPDLITWARWFEKADRIVKQTDLPGPVKVSTVFLGIDHSFGEQVQLFETMIFGGDHDDYCERYATWDEAEAGHQKAIELIFK